MHDHDHHPWPPPASDAADPGDPADTIDAAEFGTEAVPRSSAPTSRRAFLAVLGVGAGTALAASTPAVVDAVNRARGRGGRGDGERRPRENRDGGAPDTVAPEPATGDLTDAADALDLVDADIGPDRFTRLFERHEVDRRDRRELRDALIELSRPGGILDANDDLSVGPIRLITEPELSPNNLDNPEHPAGTTFFGQFIDHDLTLDADSRLGRRTSVRRSTNMRTARFDLDSVYGGGPGESPDLYAGDGMHLLVESGGLFEDLPRDADGRAIIADPRNDENLMISGMQAAFLQFHNAVLDRVRAGEMPGLGALSGAAALSATMRLVRWHYQWMVLHEYLPLIVGQALIDEILADGRRFFTGSRPRIPVEFQTSAYRFGHSLVRPSYRANLAGDDGDPFFAFVFDPDEFGNDDPNDLTGGHRAPRRFIGWQTFFDFGDGEVKNAKRINHTISTPLFRLPASAIGAARGEDLGPTSLATRNLLRHMTWEVATGQDVAGTMGVAPLAAADLSLFGDFGAQLDTRTPLWLYVLREADIVNDGLRLGPVGGRIVAEVFIGLLQLDPTSFLSAQPDWRPTLETRNGGDDFTMVDMLTVAGVDPDRRGQ